MNTYLEAEKNYISGLADWIGEIVALDDEYKEGNKELKKEDVLSIIIEADSFGIDWDEFIEHYGLLIPRVMSSLNNSAIEVLSELVEAVSRNNYEEINDYFKRFYFNKAWEMAQDGIRLTREARAFYEGLSPEKQEALRRVVR